MQYWSKRIKTKALCFNTKNPVGPVLDIRTKDGSVLKVVEDFVYLRSHVSSSKAGVKKKHLTNEMGLNASEETTAAKERRIWRILVGRGNPPRPKLGYSVLKNPCGMFGNWFMI